MIIDHGTGEYSFLAHLREGSVRVRAGQRVAAGEQVVVSPPKTLADGDAVRVPAAG